MAVELPSELQFVLGLLGIQWPQANEDELVKLAEQLKKLATQVDQVQMAADKALAALGEVYQGPAADKMAELWAGVSKYSHLIVEACETTSKALMAGAVIIEVCKGEAVVQLFSIQAQLAASSATFGMSTPAIIAAGKLVISRILDQAVQQLGRAIARPIADLAETAVGKVTGSAPERSNGHGFEVDLEAMAACAVDLRRHSDDIDSHGTSFRRVVDGLDVGNPSDMFGKIATAALKAIAESVGVEVLKRILGNFRDTADKMDQVVATLNDQEDEHSLLMNGIGPHGSLAGLSPGLALAGGVLGGAARSGGSRDAGLSAFDGLRPRLAGGADGGKSGGATGRLDGLGALHPHQAAAAGGGGEASSSTGDRTNAAVGGVVGLPTGAGRGAMRAGSASSAPRTDLEAGSRHPGGEAGIPGASGSAGARPATPGPGMVPGSSGMYYGPMSGNSSGAAGGRRGSRIRTAAGGAGTAALASVRTGGGQGGQGGHGLHSGSERADERHTGADASAEEAAAAGVPEAMDVAVPPGAPLQLGRVGTDSTGSAREEEEEEPQPEYHYEEPAVEPEDDEPFDLAMFLGDAD